MDTPTPASVSAITPTSTAETNSAHSPEANHAHPHQTSGIPSLKEHLAETWETFKSSVGNLFLLGVVSFLVNAVLLIVVIGGLAGFTTSSVDVPALIKSFETEGATALSQIPSSFYSGLAVSFVVMSIVSTIITTIFMAAMVFAVGWADKKPKLGELLKAGFSYTGWIIVFNIISFFLVFGGFWIFLVGAMVMGIFFSFGMHEMLLNNKKPWAALRGSVTLVAENFGTYLARIGFLILLLIGVSLVPIILGSIHESLGAIASFFVNILSWFFNWFALAYSIVLYKHLRAATPETETHGGLWRTLIGVSILGWIVALLLGSLVVAGVKEMLKGQNLETLFQQLETGLKESASKDGIIEPSEFNRAPSTCGISIPVPASYSEDKPARHWIYEERMMEASSFRGLVPASQTKNGVLGGFISFKTDAQRLTEKSTTLAFPGYVIYCVDNTENIDLYGFTQQALENKDYTVTLEGETERWGEVEVQPAYVEGLTSGDYYKEPIYMAVAPTANKLIIIMPWGTDEEDLEATQINENMSNIQNNLQYIGEKTTTKSSFGKSLEQ